jgi:erythromycin esterase
LCNCNTFQNLDSGLNKTLIQLIDKKDIVALGESTHGAEEFQKIRGDFVRLLVSDFNFDLIALEASFSEITLINSYVKNVSRTDLSKLMFKLSNPFLRNEEFSGLVEWIKQFNITTGRVVEFTGIDTPVDSSSILNIYSTLEGEDETLVNAFDSLFRFVKTKGVFVEKNQTYILTDSAIQVKILAFKDQVNKFKIDTNKMLLLHHHLDLVDQLVRRIEAFDYTTFMVARDSALFLNLKWAIESKRAPRTIVLAHNEHIRKQPHVSIKTMGYFTDKHFKGRYCAIGFDFGTGSFLGIIPGVGFQTIRDSLNVSSNLSLLGTQSPGSSYLVDLKKCDCLKGELPMHRIGGGGQNGGISFSTNLLENFDGFVRVEHITPLHITKKVN